MNGGSRAYVESARGVELGGGGHREGARVVEIAQGRACGSRGHQEEVTRIMEAVR